MIALILIIVAGIANAISESSNFGRLDFLYHRYPCKFTYWFSQDAYTNKYKHWILEYTPLVAFTDAFHFFKHVFIFSLFWLISLCFGLKLLTFFSIWMVFAFAFSMTYDVLIPLIPHIIYWDGWTSIYLWILFTFGQIYVAIGYVGNLIKKLWKK